MCCTSMEEGDSSIYFQGNEQDPQKGSCDDFDYDGVEEDNLMSFNGEQSPNTFLAQPTLEKHSPPTQHIEDSHMTPLSTSHTSHIEVGKMVEFNVEHIEMTLPLQSGKIEEVAWELFPSPLTVRVEYSVEREIPREGILKEVYVYAFPREGVG